MADLVPAFLMNWIEWGLGVFYSLPEWVQYLTITTWKILFVLIAVILIVAFSTYFERKVIGSMQARIGPNRVGPLGLGQPFADVIKLLIKEVVVPSQSSKFLFVIAPLLSLVPALAAWAVIPLNDWYVIADINAGLLYVLALTSVGVYGVILAGWATNSKYALLGAMRSAAQIVAYEIAMGFALVGVLMAGGSLNLGDLVRAPFDVAEGESEIVAGFHVEYSGVAFAVFFLAEYANMVLISTLTAIFFLGGWASPFEGLAFLAPLAEIPVIGLIVTGGLHWLFAKMCMFMYTFFWFRATFPRYRYDQIMRLGWKIFIPVTIIWIAVEGVMAWFQVGPWSGLGA